MSENNLNQQNLINDDEPLVKLSKGRLTFSMIVLFLLFNLDFVVRLGINAIFPLIQADLGLSDTQVGSIASAVLIGMSVFVLPISYLADKFSKKKAIIGMGILWSVGSLMTGFVKSFPALLLTRFSVGVGNSAYAPVSTSMVTTWFRKSQWGKVMGIYNISMTLGVAIGTSLAGVLAAKFGWRGAIIGLSAASLIVSLLSLFIPKDEVKKSSEEKDKKVSVKNAFIAIVKNRTLLTMSVFYGLAAMVAYAVLAWTPIYAVRVMGMSVAQAGGLLAIISLSGVVGSPLGGFILDKWYKKDMRARVWLPAIFFVLSATSYAIGYAYQIIPLIVMGQVFWLSAPSCIHTASQELVPFWFKAIAYGIVVVFIQGFGAIGPVLTGMLSENFGIQTSLIVVQILYVVAALGFLLASMSYKNDYEKSRRKEGDVLEA